MELLFIIILGFGTVALFDAIGAVLSRILNFNYAILLIGSIAIYATVAVFAAKSEGTFIGIAASFLMGLFDATVGLKISEKLKANVPSTANDFSIDIKTVVGVSIFAAVVGGIAIIIIL